jgi:putative PIN family toxin of toxin-antitoxin system
MYGVIMSNPIPIVIDTNVLVSALRSSKGASYRLFRELEKGTILAAVSVPLFLEYEEVLARSVAEGAISARSMELILDYLCAHALPVKIHYQWRPSLRDPDDEMVLEAVVASGCRWLVTHNTRDFAGAGRFGVRVISPGRFLSRMESQQ